MAGDRHRVAGDGRRLNVPVRARSAPLLPLGSAAHGACLLLFLGVLFGELVRRFGIVERKFVRVGGFFRLSVKGGDRTVKVTIFYGVLPKRRVNGSRVRFVRQNACGRVAVAHSFLFVHRDIRLLCETYHRHLLCNGNKLPANDVFFLTVEAPFGASFVIDENV